MTSPPPSEAPGPHLGPVPGTLDLPLSAPFGDALLRAGSPQQLRALWGQAAYARIYDLACALRPHAETLVPALRLSGGALWTGIHDLGQRLPENDPLLRALPVSEPTFVRIRVAATRLAMAWALAQDDADVVTGCPCCGERQLRIETTEGTQDAFLTFRGPRLDPSLAEQEAIGLETDLGLHAGFDLASYAICTCGANGLLAGMVTIEGEQK